MKQASTGSYYPNYGFYPKIFHNSSKLINIQLLQIQPEIIGNEGKT